MRANRFHPAWLCIVPVCAGLLLFPGYTGDDTFIHLTFARSLAHGEGFTYNGGPPTYGTTSPLWVLLLGLGGWTGLPLLPLARGLSLLSGAAVVLAAWRLSRRLGIGTDWSRVATLAVAVNPLLLRWTFTGMESSLAVLLALVSTERYLAERGCPGGIPWSGVLLGLAVLTRPELGMLALLVFGDAALRRESARTQLLRWAALAILVGAWCTAAEIHFGTMLPNTLRAKSLGRGGTKGALGALFRALAALLAVAWLDVLLVVWAVRSGRGRTAEILRDLRRRGIGLMAAWPLLLLGFYVLQQVVVVSRYALVGLPFLSILAAAWAERSGATRRAVSWMITLYVLGSILMLGVVIVPHTRSFARGFQATYHRIGHVLRQEAEPGDRVAAADIGILGFESGLPVIDTVGLVTPEMIGRRDRLTRALALRPEFLVDKTPLPWELRMEQLSGVLPTARKLLLRERIPGVGITEPTGLEVGLFRLRWLDGRGAPALGRAGLRGGAARSGEEDGEP